MEFIIMRLTKTAVDKIEAPGDRDQMFYRDAELKGFALRVTRNGIKSFVVEKLVNRKVRRLTLGRYGELTVEQARKEAQKLLGKIATGIDPVIEKQKARAKSVTLAEVFQDYCRVKKNLKAKTVYSYEKLLQTALGEWKKKSLLSISKNDVLNKHAQIGKENGPAYANVAMRLLRALFNFAIDQYEDSYGKALISENPVKRLSKTRSWYRVKRRKTYITSPQLSGWYQGVMQLESEMMRDYFVLILLTGLRRTEAASLEKKHIDLDAKTLLIADPKNYEPHTLPLTKYLCELLKRRIEASSTDHLFPADSKVGYLVEPRKQIDKIIEKTGVQFTVHDLRRTFITIAESLDVPAYALKRLLNHKIDNSDVTAGYIVTDVERLRRPMEKIGDYILELCYSNANCIKQFPEERA